MTNKFRFSIIDDTDDATYENIKPIYDFLYSKKIFITKTVWVYPPRDKHSRGDSLQRKKYLDYIRELSDKGFEIGLHNVGSGNFSRNEISRGVEEFKKKLGFYPKIQINHSYNMDSIYGGYKRFNWPINLLIKKLYPQYSREFMGEVENSKYFWGDLHKKIIFFSRNHEFSDIITSNIDNLMPYKDPKRSKYANYWFSSTFAPNQQVFKHVMSDKNIDRLEKSNGTSIIYTHFGYFFKNGQVDIDFIKSIEYLSKKKNGIFKPVSKILNDIALEREQNGKAKFPKISNLKKIQYELYHLLTRIYFRKIVKIDDYEFKNLNKEMFTK
tara:strand:+ start:74 stop:1051 length:978 start_codon:yes stop_codon:yes gene_type:complete